MVSPHHFAHWYPTAAYLYILWLDALALAWEYLRGIPITGSTGCAVAAGDAAHRWGLRLLEDPALDARDAHPAWLPAMLPWCSSIPMPTRRPMPAFAFWRIPGHKQLLHDGKGWR
jgi:hypothetical protein